ncbi:XRE family transcriptional regulator [Buttiauxella selenatireducens]|uniref:XRE family transcriptional regulator n=1 Tax=Buttiauxella selenatireducens TaxID=3073902 RepID=A0ABY9SGH3_9ENTR|nr:XRE family transcriptional regulator [Buttiauxella sp. R73]WMY75945.1 XRE family transcriptional regulator [Buttiauxella sp. R73]
MGSTLEELLARETPEGIAEVEKIAAEMRFNIHLAELREKVDKTQADMAQALGIRQPTVAVLERPGRDLKLSTLRRYVEAAGGKLSITVELPDGTHYGFTL